MTRRLARIALLLDRTEDRTLAPRRPAALLLFLLLLPLLLLLDAAPAAAQGTDVSGIWHNRRPSGVYVLTLHQNGTRVDGTYPHGTIEGTLRGNVLEGAYSDIMARGRFVLTLGADGSSFQGHASSGNGWQPWSGTRTGTLAQAPAGILRGRARLDEVTGSGAAYDQQAVTACNNLFAATYAKTNDGWTSAFTTGAGSFAPVLGAPASGTTFIQVRDVGRSAPQSTPFSDADQLNGWQYKGTVIFTGKVYRVHRGSGWEPWRDGGGSSFVRCTYQVRSGVAEIRAIDVLLGVELERLVRPN